jgi:uncharacterized repeat protein (TIGR03803 family)
MAARRLRAMLPSVSSLLKNFRHLAVLLTLSALFVTTASAAPEAVLHNFTGNSAGSYPLYNLIWDRFGNLYGESNGDFSSEGNVFELSPDSNGGWTYTEIYGFGFDGRDGGAYPAGPLTMDDDGNLYGVTQDGGTNSTGTVYKLTKANGAWTITYLYNFGPQLGGDGFNPTGVVYYHGALFGTTPYGGKSQNQNGTLFAVRPNSDGSWSESILRNFGVSENDGQHPNGGLAFDSEGNIYGTTLWGGSRGGSNQGGTVFQLSRLSDGSWQEHILHSFTYRDGYEPGAATPIFDSRGDLYSTTTSGGSAGLGVVFELTPSGDKWTETVLHNFTGGEDGASPNGITFDSHGQLFGTTATGGGNGICLDQYHNYQNVYCGTVYKLTPSASGHWKESLLYGFPGGANGSVPVAGVVLDSGDNVYGVAGQGGSYGLGVAFRISNAAPLSAPGN